MGTFNQLASVDSVDVAMHGIQDWPLNAVKRWATAMKGSIHLQGGSTMKVEYTEVLGYVIQKRSDQNGILFNKNERFNR